MRKMFLAMCLLAVVAAFGCSTTSTPFASHGELLQFSGREALKKVDPTAKIDPSQTAMVGINGPAGPYAAAIGAGSISDSKARTETLEAIKTISDNESYGGWGRRGSYGGWSTIDKPQHGTIVNRSSHTRVILFRSAYNGKVILPRTEVPAKSYLDKIALLPGEYQVEVFSIINPADTDLRRIGSAGFSINEEGRDCEFYPPGQTRSQKTDWLYTLY
ncbi:MAG TPA: hypothetical protein PK619_02395 [bacterium]|nr:hypothetical protein [bacterium]HPN81565.1 hypothetical protein [bacterium]HPW39548.1 hypothetical protein [bacterium]